MWRGWLLNGVEPNMKGPATEWGGAKCGGAGHQSISGKMTLLKLGVKPNMREASCQSVSQKMKLMKGVDLGRHS